MYVNFWLKKFLALVVCAAFVGAAMAAKSASDTSPASADEGMTVEQFVASLHPQTGTVAIPSAQATLALGDNYVFLPARDAQRVLTDLWGNPPDTSVLGLILPGKNATSLLDDDAWAVVVSYVDDGYVSDEDASKINYDDMLKDMQQAARDANPERVKQGYPAMELVGWAEPPHYDATSHKLYWARNLKFTSQKTGETGQSLNYGIRVLGRKGYLVLNAVAPIGQLAQVRTDMQQVVQMANFDAGQRYADYQAGTDKLAAYGIGALIAGAAAKKLGLLALAGAFIAKFAKVGILAVLGVLAVIGRFFRRKPKKDGA